MFIFSKQKKRIINIYYNNNNNNNNNNNRMSYEDKLDYFFKCIDNKFLDI